MGQGGDDGRTRRAFAAATHFQPAQAALQQDSPSPPENASRGELDLYKTQLGEMQTALAQIRMMLLARQASLEAGRAQLSAVSQWISAFRQTR